MSYAVIALTSRATGRDRADHRDDERLRQGATASPSRDWPINEESA